MALTTCSECDSKISDKAEACPKCGAPQRGAVTIQATAKRYKAGQLLGALLTAFGFVWLFSGGELWGTLATLAGLGLYAVARFGAWWRHG